MFQINDGEGNAFFIFKEKDFFPFPDDVDIAIKYVC